MGPQQMYPPMFYPSYVPPINPLGQVQMPSSPYTQPMQPQQPAQQPVQQTTFIQGRVVNSEDDIRPNEVPMDGSVTLFPQSDYSIVYGKTWTKEGTIKNMRFLLEQENPVIPEEVKQTPVMTEDIVTGIVQQVVQDQMESLIEQYLKPMNDALSKIKPTSNGLIV